MSHRRPVDYIQVTNLLSQWIGQHIKFLKETACMDQQSRELIALLDAFCESPNARPETKEMIQKRIMPYVRRLGWARWPRDTLSDMGLRKGDTTKRENLPNKTMEPVKEELGVPS